MITELAVSALWPNKESVIVCYINEKNLDYYK